MPCPWPNAEKALLTDPWFAPVVERVGPPDLRPRAGSAFSALASSIIHQQLAGAAAGAIHRRFLDVVGGLVTPENVLTAAPEALRSAGLSGNKLEAILDLARKATDGSVPLVGLSDLDDGAVVAGLTRVRGIGPWTARMFLIFHLHRPDVWPVGDLGVRNGWALIHRLPGILAPKAMGAAGDHLRPWRSAAAWYCWRALELEGTGG